MSTIDLPDPVMVWEATEEHDYKDSYAANFTIRALVGGVIIFEQRYQDDDWNAAHAYDLEDAKRKAAEDLGERLRELINASDQ